MPVSDESVELTIEKIVFGGQALAHYDGKTVFVWNALPGERVKAVIAKRRSKLWEAIATDILQPSPKRIPAVEESYLATSPWQVLSPEYETECKQTIAIDTYTHIGKLALPNEVKVVDDTSHIFGYRNKMEFSFYEFDVDDTRGTGQALAFFQRGSKYKIPLPHGSGSQLAEPIINTVALHLLDWVNQHKLTRLDVKSIIVRSNGNGQAIAGLFLKNKVTLDSPPELIEGLLGLQVFYSTHKSPASVPTELLYRVGDEQLAVTVSNVTLQFGLFSFFQVNIPVFQQALNDIAIHVPNGTHLLDLYSGVGSIGLPLAQQCGHVTLVETNQEAVEFAQRNITENAIPNASVLQSATEAVTDLITADTTVIVDPPRAGLHHNVVERLLEVQPETIIYMSCNLSTQARDLQLLNTIYEITWLQLYNFFPRTPHVEAVSVLRRR